MIGQVKSNYNGALLLVKGKNFALMSVSCTQCLEIFTLKEQSRVLKIFETICEEIMLDCHCHLLDLPDLTGEFFSNMAKCNIKKMYCNSVSVRQWSYLTSLLENYPTIIPFYGIHPWHLEGATDDNLKLLALFLEENSSCCGEIGLDRLCTTDFSFQERIFRKQLDIAMTTQSFVAIHCVKSWGRMLEILSEYQGKIFFMLHSFQGKREVMERLVAMGGMISFSDRVIHPDQQRLQDVLKATPLENLLLESDFPFHKSVQGTSVSTYCQVLANLYSFVSHLRQIPVGELAHIIENNGSICTY